MSFINNEHMISSYYKKVREGSRSQVESGDRSLISHYNRLVVFTAGDQESAAYRGRTVVFNPRLQIGCIAEKQNVVVQIWRWMLAFSWPTVARSTQFRRSRSCNHQFAFAGSQGKTLCILLRSRQGTAYSGRSILDGAHTFRSSPIHSLEANGLQFRSKTPCPPFIDTAAQAPSDLFPLDDDRSHPAGLIVAPTSAPSPRWDTAVSTRPEGPQTSAGIDIRALLSDAEPATPLPWLVRPARAAQPDSAAVSLVPHPRRDPPGSNTEPAGQPLQSVSAGGGGADMPGASSRAAERGHGPAPGASVPDVSPPPRLFPAAESRLPPLRLALLGLGPTADQRRPASAFSIVGQGASRAARDSDARSGLG